MLFRLINRLTSDFGLSAIGLVFPIVGLTFWLFGHHPFNLSYESWALITGGVYCGLLLAISGNYRGLIQGLSITFPSVIVILSVLPVFTPGLLDWPVLYGWIAFAAILEMVTLKPENWRW